MPLNILDLPEEVLDPIIGALLPGHSLNRLFLDTRIDEQPVDLLCCRLVCRILFRHASCWLCHRVHLKSYRFKQHIRVTGSPFTHPEYASNTRELHIASPTDEFVFYEPEAQAFPSPTNPPLFSRMINLRILIVQLFPTLVTEILPQLLPLSMLHTVVLEGSDGTVDSVDSVDWSCIGGPFPHIKKLDFRRILNIGPLISLSPCLEELAVRPSTGLDEVLNSFAIPWHTLRQLTLEDILEFEMTCVALMESYQGLRDDDGLCVSLTELMVTQNLTITDAHCLLTTFSGQPLRSLLVGCVVNFDIQFVERVVATFPNLREFSLLKISAESHVSTMELNHYATALGRLRELRILHLNWIRHHDDDHVWLQNQLDIILAPIVARCLKLTRVRFMHQADGLSTMVIITRDQGGQYKNCVCETHRDRCSLAAAAGDGDSDLFI